MSYLWLVLQEPVPKRLINSRLESAEVRATKGASDLTSSTSSIMIRITSSTTTSTNVHSTSLLVMLFLCGHV